MKKGIKTSIILALVIALFIAYTGIGYAFGADEHDPFMEEVLYGERNSIPSYRTDLINKSTELKYASFLAIDQVEKKNTVVGDKEKLNFLQNQGVSNLPKSISEISFSSNVGQHRKFTHLGWNHNYSNEDGSQKKWEIRKRILLNTTNDVFDFGIVEELPGKFGISYCEQCDAFAELVYYVHVLGDNIHFYKKRKDSNDYAVPTEIVPFAGTKTKDNINIAIEITGLMPKLFKNHSANNDSKRHYRELMHELKVIDKKCQTIAYSEKRVNNRANNSMYKYSKKMMELLVKHVPKLLENEKFFIDVFNQ